MRLTAQVGGYNLSMLKNKARVPELFLLEMRSSAAILAKHVLLPRVNILLMWPAYPILPGLSTFCPNAGGRILQNYPDTCVLKVSTVTKERKPADHLIGWTLSDTAWSTIQSEPGA